MDITILIKTIERKKSLIRLLKSIDATGLEVYVYVADDSQTSYKKAIKSRFPRLVDRYVEMPYDSGISRGRNVLLSEVETDYFVLCDDDFIFDARTDLGWMKQSIENNDIDLIGGLFFEPRGILKQLFLRAPALAVNTGIAKFCRGTGLWVFREETKRYHGRFEIENDVLCREALGSLTKPIQKCDYVHNFFMANTSAVRRTVGGWEEDLKVNEHWDFFLRAKQSGLRVASTEEVGVTHLPVRSGDYYTSYRDRENKFENIALEKHGLKDIR